MTFVNPESWEPAEEIRLDEETRAIVKDSHNAAIVAGPGAGKTELLAQRASFLLETNSCPDPRRILAISFKRDASKNLRLRVRQRVGDRLAGRLESYTFDAFAKSLVDRFLSGLPQWCRPSRKYRITFPRAQEWRDFALDYGLNGQQLEAAHLQLGEDGGALPLHEPAPSTVMAQAALAWWRDNLDATPSRLSFNMISILAMTILKHNPRIAEAMRRTYSHVFLDEFQDTTGLQYRLVETGFMDSRAVLTAVGDTKQRIMTWAGALPGNFESFITDFKAEREVLRSNFRSTPRIVEIINAMAKMIESDAVEAVAARPASADANVDGYMCFNSAADEAALLSDWVAKNAEAGLSPSDFLFLVRQNANDVEAQLQPDFNKRGLSIRNEARTLTGGVAIQELMTEPLSDLVIAILQLAVEDRTDAPYQRVWDALSDSFDLDEDRAEPVLRLEGKIREVANYARDLIKAKPTPGDVDFEVLLGGMLEKIPFTAIQQLAPDYEDEARLGQVVHSIITLLGENRSLATWQALISSYLGRDQVRLMTVHKAKGLEAHSVVFLHLQDNAFHPSFKEQDEKFTFFVAASRARDRFYVTSTSMQQTRVKPLWNMVHAAGMKQLQVQG